MAITDGTTPQTNTTGTPIQTTSSEPTRPVDLDLSLDLPPVEKTETTPDTDWLKEEDKLTQKEAPIESSLIKEVPSAGEAEDLKSEAIPQSSIIAENLPQEAKNMTLKDDMSIIQDLQKPQIQENIIQAKNPEIQSLSTTAGVNTPMENSVVQHDEVVQQPKASTIPTTMNLDNILLDTTPAQPAPAKNPFDLIQANTPAVQVANPATMTTPIGTMPQAVADTHKWVKIGLFIVLFVALGFIGYFIVNTMYPMWLFSSNTWSDILAELPTSWYLLTGEIFTGWEVVSLATGETALDSGHASADDENFQDLSNVLDTDVTIPTGSMTAESLIPQFTMYQDAGTKYFQASKAANDLQGMKRALYLSRKSEALLNKVVENANAIDTMQLEITTQLAQSKIFLTDLEAKYGPLTPTQANTNQTDFMTSE